MGDKMTLGKRIMLWSPETDFLFHRLIRLMFDLLALSLSHLKSILLHVTCSYLCLCWGSVLPYSWLFICFLNYALLRSTDMREIMIFSEKDNTLEPETILLFHCLLRYTFDPIDDRGHPRPMGSLFVWYCDSGSDDIQKHFDISSSSAFDLSIRDLCVKQ
jgi:hypothetical protein